MYVVKIIPLEEGLLEVRCTLEINLNVSIVSDLC